ncbi:minor capsid protein [Xanthomonas phage NEB7]|nr:minor capsid protein [Xanthomonas phage NEB7]
MLTNPTRKQKQLAVIGPSSAAEQQYRKALQRAVKAMAKSVEYWALAKYRAALVANQDTGNIPDPEAAQDATSKTPFDVQRALFKELEALRTRWETYFKDVAKHLAVDVVNAAYQANKTAWQGRVRKEGFDIPLQLSAAQRTILDVKVNDNVALIRSIPEQYFTKIQGDVSRGFLAGRDLEAIASELRDTGKTTVKRAALIARDQSNKLTAQMNSARQRELGVRYAYWKHSTVDKDPRPGHIRASKELWIFDTQVGIDFGDQFGFVLPSMAINCRCGSRSIIPAIDEDLGPDDLLAVPGFPGAFTRKPKTR